MKRSLTEFVKRALYVSVICFTGFNCIKKQESPKEKISAKEGLAILMEGLGDLFVIRNAGNSIGDYELGSVEYAVEHLHTPLAIVLGHTQCGAVGTFIEHKKKFSSQPHPKNNRLYKIRAGRNGNK